MSEKPVGSCWLSKSSMRLNSLMALMGFPMMVVLQSSRLWLVLSLTQIYTPNSNIMLAILYCVYIYIYTYISLNIDIP